MAQSRWCAETRAVVNFPLADFGNTQVAVGLGFGGNLSYRIVPHLLVYAGWQWNQFSEKELVSGPVLTFEEEGYRFGYRYYHRIGSTALNYNVALGGIYNHIAAVDAYGSIVENSGHGLGWEAGSGLSVKLGGNWRLGTDLLYHDLSRSIKMDDRPLRVNLRYIAAGIGITWSF
jgi:hypothetical protein